MASHFEYPLVGSERCVEPALLHLQVGQQGRGRHRQVDVAGDLAIGWSQGLSLRAELNAGALNPSHLGPSWPSGPIDVDTRLDLDNKSIQTFCLHLRGQGAEVRLQGESLDQIVSELTLALDAGVQRRGDTLVVRSRGGRR